MPEVLSPARQMDLAAHGLPVHFQLYQSTSDPQTWPAKAALLLLTRGTSSRDVVEKMVGQVPVDKLDSDQENTLRMKSMVASPHWSLGITVAFL